MATFIPDNLIPPAIFHYYQWCRNRFRGYERGWWAKVYSFWLDYVSATLCVHLDRFSLWYILIIIALSLAYVGIRHLHKDSSPACIKQKRTLRDRREYKIPKELRKIKFTSVTLDIRSINKDRIYTISDKPSEDECVTIREYLHTLKYSGPHTSHEVILKILQSIFQSRRMATLIAHFVPNMDLLINQPVERVNDFLRNQDVLNMPSGEVICALNESFNALPKESMPEDDAPGGDNTAEAKLLRGGDVEDIVKDIVDTKMSFEAMIDALGESSRKSLRPTAPIVSVDDGLLPDLYFGPGGLKAKQTDYQARMNELLACIFSRLSGNHLLECNDPGVFAVPFKAGQPPINKIGKFVERMLDDGWVSSSSVTTDFSNFGFNLCMLDREPTLHGDERDTLAQYLPVISAIGLDTGLCDPNSQSDGTLKVLATHGAISLKLEAPEDCYFSSDDDGNKVTLKQIEVQFYMGVEGFSGWHANNNFQYPWAPYTNHQRIIPADRQVECIRSASFLGACICRAATQRRWHLGGYGMMGVCNDSAAIVEYSLFGETTLFPLYAHALARQQLPCVIRELGELNDMKRTPLRLAQAVHDYPCDVGGTPRDLLDRIKRIRKSTIIEKEGVWTTPFPVLKKLMSHLPLIEKELIRMIKTEAVTLI